MIMIIIVVVTEKCIDEYDNTAIVKKTCSYHNCNKKQQHVVHISHLAIVSTYAPSDLHFSLTSARKPWVINS